jgi:hypothetical protein
MDKGCLVLEAPSTSNGKAVNIKHFDDFLIRKNYPVKESLTHEHCTIQLMQEFSCGLAGYINKAGTAKQIYSTARCFLENKFPDLEMWKTQNKWSASTRY